MTDDSIEEICPDCKHPVASHALFKEGRCPVVRFGGTIVRFGGTSVRVPVLTGPIHTVEGDDLPPLDASDPRFGTGLGVVAFEVCPRCGHTDEQHDEAGCYICACTGP